MRLRSADRHERTSQEHDERKTFLFYSTSIGLGRALRRSQRATRGEFITSELTKTTQVRLSVAPCTQATKCYVLRRKPKSNECLGRDSPSPPVG